MAICTGNSMTYGKIMIRDPVNDVSRPFASLSKKFDWSSPLPPLESEPSWSHWDVLIRFILASYGHWYMDRFPDEFKLPFKRTVEDKIPPPGDSDNHDSGKRPNTRSSSKAGSQFQGSGGGGVSSTQFALAPVFWEDLWAPLRLAIPATHSVALEHTSAHLPGDAELLAEGRMGSTYRQTLQGHDVVIKTLPYSCRRDVDDMRDVFPTMLRDEMRHELNVYQRLKKLQGTIIPKLLWYGEIVEGMADALATEYIGPALTADNLTPVLAKSALHALETLHKHDVLHGDVVLRNFCIRGSDVMIIDFGFAKFRQDLPDVVWSSKVTKERELLLKELGFFGQALMQKPVQSTVAGQKRGFVEVQGSDGS